MVELPSIRGLEQRLIAHTSEGQASYLLIGRRGNYIKLAPSAYHLLRSVSSGLSFEALAARMSQQRGQPVDPQEFAAAYQHVVDHITAIESKETRKPAGFWVQLRLLPAAAVDLVGRLLSYAFHPLIATTLIAGIIGIFVLSAQTFGLASLVTVDEESITSFWTLYGLFLLSLIAHEFGHASACARFGVRPSEIGFAIYWIYPVFYTNVNAAWQLNRRQRVVVDLAGVFFQLIVGTVYLLLAWLYSWDIGRQAFVTVFYSCFFTINPFLKFDGYWVLADSLGIMNLGQQIGRVLRAGYDRLRGRSHPPLPWSRRIIAVLAVYILGSVGFWAYFVWWMVPEAWEVVSHYPQDIALLIDALLITPQQVPTEALEEVYLHTFIVVGLGFMIFNLLRRLQQPMRALQQRLA